MEHKKKNTIRITLYYVVCFLCGIAIGFISTQFYLVNGIGVQTLSVRKMLIRLFLLIVAFLLQLFLHETGHLVFGLFSGYGFVSFRIFNIMILNDHGHLLVKRLHLDGTAGQCLMSPPEPVSGHIPGLLYNMGGVLMNLIFGFAAMILIYIFHDHKELIEWLFQFVLFGVIFALLNGIPFASSTISNDGANAIALESNPKANRAFYLQMKMNAMLSEGVSLSGMPQEWFTVPDDADMENPLIATIGVFACNRLMEQHRFTDMEQLIVHFMSIPNGINDIHWQLLKCDLLFVRLLAGKQGELITSLLDKPIRKVMKTMKDFPSVIRTQYAVSLLHEQDENKAEKYRRHMAEIADSYPYHTDIMHENDLMILAKQQYQRNREQVQ